MQLYLGIGGLLLFAGVMGALAIWARRLGSLISLHHHLAGGTNNKGDPKRSASKRPPAKSPSAGRARRS
jgi:hypothetical protein